jgi:hypothetical protein
MRRALEFECVVQIESNVCGLHLRSRQGRKHESSARDRLLNRGSGSNAVVPGAVGLIAMLGIA